MNGLTGYKSQKIFQALVNESVNNDARNLVEYCCFRFLSRDNSAIHPCLKVCGLGTSNLPFFCAFFYLKTSSVGLLVCNGVEIKYLV